MEPAVVIESVKDPAIARIRDLSKNSRGPVRTVVIEDVEPITECLRAGVEFDVLHHSAGEPLDPDLADLAAERDVPIRPVAPEIVNDLFRDDRKAKTFGVAKVPKPARMGDLYDLDGDVVVLDGVRIPGNIGAIVRTATALGASGVVLLDSGLDTIADRRLIRASRGFVFTLPVVLASTEQWRSFIGDTGLVSVAMDANGDSDLATVARAERRIAWIFGSEKDGPSEAVMIAVDSVVSLPIRTVESLNVSVSVGIVMYARAGYNIVG